MPSHTLPARILLRLPPDWRSLLARVRAEVVTRGMSGARVWRLRTRPARYLKVADGSDAPLLREEIARTRWLGASGIRVARVVRAHCDAGFAAMMTDAVPGIPADAIDAPAERLLPALGRGLSQLHALQVQDCPFDERLAVRLARARAAIEQGSVDPSQFEPRNRRIAPSVLLARLAARLPREDLVVAHGDASLSNMFIDRDGTLCFIDCGHAGRADRYLDLAVLAAEVAGHFGHDAVRIVTRAYGIRRLNASKAAYYADLYELF